MTFVKFYVELDAFSWAILSYYIGVKKEADDRMVNYQVLKGWKCVLCMYQDILRLCYVLQ